ncbi:MAG: FmdC precursor [Cyclobacteriaceae bacterium]
MINLKRTKMMVLTVLVMALHHSSNSQQTIDGQFGKGVFLAAKDDSFTMKFAFRFQTLYDGKYDLDNDSYSEKLMIRRSRLKFDGYAFTPKLKYKLELALSNRDTQSGIIAESGFTSNYVLDAALKYNFAPGWELWAGQTKLPGNRERVISSANLQFVDRSLVNSRFNIDRDIGIQIRHKSKVGSAVINQAVAISTGEGRNIIATNFDNGRQYTGRIEFLPMGDFTSKGDYIGSDLSREETPKLSIGITGDFNNKTVRSRGNLGSFQVDDITGEYIATDLTTLFVDAMFKVKGYSFASEYAYRSSSVEAGFGHGNGFVGQTGYLFDNNIELSARYTQINAGSDLSSINDQDEYTLGFSKYFKGHKLKIQSDASYQTVNSTRNYMLFRVQCELHL